MESESTEGTEVKPGATIPRLLPGSGIREIMNAALTMKGVLRVEVGEPDFPTPAHIVHAGQRALAEGVTRYTANAGRGELRQAVAEKVRDRNGIEADPDQIVVTHGAVSALMNAFTALLDPGDQVLLPDPGWPNYEMMVRLVGAEVVRYPLIAEQGFLPDLDTLERLVTSRTKAIVLNSPSNPTGAVFPPEILAGLVRFAQAHDLWLISDEAYEDVVFEGQHVSPARFDEDGRVISIFTFSKTYAMTGWRVGYMVVPKPLFPVANKLQEAFIACANAPAQFAALAALRGPREPVDQMRTAYRRRRDIAVALLQRMDVPHVVPSGAFYLMVNISRASLDTYGFARWLLQQKRVAVAPGETFGPGGRGWIRVALCTQEEILLEALMRIAQALQELNKSSS